MSSLASGGPPTEAAALALGSSITINQSIPTPHVVSTSNLSSRIDTNNGDVPSDQTLAFIAATGLDEDRGPEFQAHKTAFFFKLERELEKV